MAQSGKKNSVIQEHINGFEKGLRQAAFFYKDVDAQDSRFDVDKDVVGGKLVGEDEEGGEEVGNEAVEEEKDVDATVEGDDNKAAQDVVFMIFYFALNPKSVITRTIF